MEDLQGGTLALEHHYHLDRRIDSFGLVTLYAGTQDPFGLPVQITVYDRLPELGAGVELAERIEASARRASLLDEPGLFAVVDFGEIGEGIPFVIEQTVSGSSLAKKLQSQSVFSPRQVLALVDRIAPLLQNAHDRDIYHGNLKPEWIALPEGDEGFEAAHIGHFGLSPSMEELVQMPQAVLTTDLVEAFPPEAFDVAARDESPDEDADDDSPPSAAPHLTARADQWALGALTFRLLVGMHPYFDDPVDASEGILRIKTEQPPSLAEMGIDQEIADVVDRALSPDPQERWPSVDHFRRALRDAIDDSPKETDRSDDSPTPAPVDGGRKNAGLEDSPDSDLDPLSVPGPRPSGYLLTIALGALILSNLTWFFFTMADDGESTDLPEQAAEEIAGSMVLPSGLQLETSPADAELLRLRNDQEEVLGTTPLVLSESLLNDGELHLLIRHGDYLDQPLFFRDSELGPSLRLPLIADRVDDGE